MAVRTALTMTTSSDELMSNRALPSDGNAEVIFCRVDDMLGSCECQLFTVQYLGLVGWKRWPVGMMNGLKEAEWGLRPDTVLAGE